MGMFIEIRNVINDIHATGGYWSKWDDNVWDKNYTHIINLR